ncbi:MAG: sulfurtransferase TusA family protein [Sulfurospirillaceae bacterium]|nr:sulfurtransferase TusA family protein [Sulfurospirillaceae bacterium]MDD3463401.1 sulfurtransferase TusA family protein [Sulfurospirillaceae bacterium]
MKTIDVRGLSCPAPVLEVKNVIDSGAKEIKVISDCGASTENIQRFAQNAGFTIAMKKLDDDTTEFILTK